MQDRDPPSGAASERRLDSWKAIADYLRHDVSTVMRWERAAGLPVRRVPGGRGRSVFAYAADIDRWLAGRDADAGDAADVTESVTDTRPTPGFVGRFWPIAGVLVVVLGVALAGFAMYGRSGGSTVVSARVVDRTVVAFDASGRAVWRYELGDAHTGLVVGSARLSDVDADGRNEAVVTASIWRTDNAAMGLVALLDDSGRLRWRQSLHDHYVFGGVDYGPEWFPSDALVYDSPAGSRVAIAFHHHTWWPAVVATFDHQGRRVGTFVNAGWIHRLALSQDGRYVLAAGVNNGLGGAAVAVIDAAKGDGVSPADGSTAARCSNCPAGAPAAYFVVPWSDIARPADTPSVVVHVAQSGQVELRASQMGPADGLIPEIIVGFSPAMVVTDRSVSDAFRVVHGALERTGKVTHAFARCPWAAAPPVREWTAAAGWREIGQDN